MAKAVLDACCGSRMFWFDKSHPSVVYMDNRELEEATRPGVPEAEEDRLLPSGTPGPYTGCR